MSNANKEKINNKEKICKAIEQMNVDDDLQLTLAFEDQRLGILNIIDNTQAGIYIAEHFNEDLVDERTGTQIIAYQIKRNYSF